MEGKGRIRKDTPVAGREGWAGRGVSEDLGATGINVCRPRCSGGAEAVPCCPVSVPLLPLVLEGTRQGLGITVAWIGSGITF